MSDKVETRKKKAGKDETPVHTIRQAAVAASIWRRQSPAGYVYYDFSLTRSWKSVSSGNTGYSRNFFARNREELLKVIEEATQWIQDHEARMLQDEVQVT
jgi:hypothetical protein